MLNLNELMTFKTTGLCCSESGGCTAMPTTIQCTPEELVAFRLRAQSLAEQPCTQPRDLVARMGAIQAQDFNAARKAVAARLPAETDSELFTADFNSGRILRTHILRPTWHFVTPETIRGMYLLCGDRLRAAFAASDRKLRIDAKLYLKSETLIQRLLQGGRQCTRNEIRAELSQHGVTADATLTYHLLYHAETVALLCSGALRGKEQTYALLDERAPTSKYRTPSRDEALEQLCRAYFRSHGPATVQDFAWWSGLWFKDVHRGIEAARPYLTEAVCGSKTYLLDSELAAQTTPAALPQILLLPAFDEYIIAYRDRSPVLPDEHAAKVISRQGMFFPVVVVNGKVAGLWRSKPATTFDLFSPLDSKIMRKLKAAAEKITIV
jgi:hypothetical protein